MNHYTYRSICLPGALDSSGGSLSHQASSLLRGPRGARWLPGALRVSAMALQSVFSHQTWELFTGGALLPSPVSTFPERLWDRSRVYPEALQGHSDETANVEVTGKLRSV